MVSCRKGGTGPVVDGVVDVQGGHTERLDLPAVVVEAVGNELELVLAASVGRRPYWQGRVRR